MATCEVLLVYANPLTFPVAQPYGLDILSGVLRSRGTSSAIVLPYSRSNPLKELVDACKLTPPKVVGFSLRNLDTARVHYDDDGERTFLDELIILIKAVRVFSPIVALGGSGFAIAPKEILNETGADIGFIGASEYEFSEFCWRVLHEGFNVEEASRDLSCAIRAGKTKASLPVTTLGSPRRWSGLGVTGSMNWTVPVRTKTGCSLNCSYCVVPNIDRLILRPWKDIQRELQATIDLGLQDRVFIADGEFNLPSVERAIELCRSIRSEFGTTIKWACYLEAGYTTPELLQAMLEAGCNFISLTVDSFSRETRIGYIKRTKPECAIKATQLCLSSGIRTDVNLLFGGPNETLETARSSAQIAASFINGVAFSVTVGLRVYPGTPLSKMVVTERYRPFFQPCQRFKWLGRFCSPIPANELAAYLVPVLPPSSTVIYTNRELQSGNPSELTS